MCSMLLLSKLLLSSKNYLNGVIQNIRLKLAGTLISNLIRLFKKILNNNTINDKFEFEID